MPNLHIQHNGRIKKRRESIARVIEMDCARRERRKEKKNKYKKEKEGKEEERNVSECLVLLVEPLRPPLIHLGGCCVVMLSWLHGNETLE